MKKLLFFLFLGMFIILQAEVKLTKAEIDWIKNHKIIRLTGDPDWLPLEKFTEDGRYIGITSEIIKELEKILPLKFKIFPTKTWSTSMRLAIDKEVDLLVSIKNIPRQEYFKYTEILYEYPVVVITNKKARNFNSMEDIMGYRVAIPKHYGFVPELKEKYGYVKYEEVTTIREGLTKVEYGEVDAFISGLTPTYYQMQKHGYKSLKVNMITDINVQVGIGVRKDWPILLGILNKGIKDIPKEKIEEIRKKWIDYEYDEKIKINK